MKGVWIEFKRNRGWRSRNRCWRVGTFRVWKTVILMIILGNRQSMSHYLHFADDKTKVHLSDFPNSSQILSRRAKIHLSLLTPSLGLLILYQDLRISLTFTGAEIDSDLISWTWILEPGIVVLAVSRWLVLFSFSKPQLPCF